MSKGYVMMAMGKDYIQQAYLCALSIKQTQKINTTCLITNEKLSKKYQEVFDHVIPIPWTIDKDYYMTQERWKVYHASPFTESILLDTDMIFLTSQDYVWEYMKPFDICFPASVKNYRNKIVTDSFYRQAFVKNNLPMIYCAQHYFKKSTKAHNYYNILELICKNYEDFYNIYVKKAKPKYCSMDLNHAIAVTHLNLNDCFSHTLSFTHMKSRVQDWENPTENWLEDIQFYFDQEKQLQVGNYKQLGLFHYVENAFCEKVVKNYA